MLAAFLRDLRSMMHGHRQMRQIGVCKIKFSDRRISIRVIKELSCLPRCLMIRDARVPERSKLHGFLNGRRRSVWTANQCHPAD